MNIELSGKDLFPADLLKDRITTKLDKIEQRLGQKLFVRVKLSQESPKSYSVAIHFNARHDYNATGHGADLVKAADDALHKIERQVRKVQHKADGGRHGASIRDSISEPVTS